MFKRLLARLVRSPRFQAFIAHTSSVGHAPTLSAPSAPMFGEESDAPRRIMELEAERDALAAQLSVLRRRVEDLERALARAPKR